MNAPRYWKSPDGKRTVDLDDIVRTDLEATDMLCWRIGVVEYFKIKTCDITSFLAALDAWRAREDGPPLVRRVASPDLIWDDEPAKPAIDLHGWRPLYEGGEPSVGDPVSLLDVRGTNWPQVSNLYWRGEFPMRNALGIAWNKGFVTMPDNWREIIAHFEVKP